MDPSSNPHLLVVSGHLQLASQQEFRRKLSNCWLEDRVAAPTPHTRVHEIHRWSSWYAERQVDLLSHRIWPFLEFLTGLQYCLSWRSP